MTARHLLSLAALAALSATATLPARAQTAFVSSEKDHKLTVVDLKTQAVTGTIATCKRPRHMVLMPEGRQLLVACGDSGQADLIDLATRIVVVDDGRIVELGAHNELLELDGQYAHLWRTWRD